LPTPEDLAREREIDEALFSDDVAVSQQPDQRGSLDFAFTRDTEAEHHDIAVDDLDAALFGTAPANGSVPDAGTPEATAPHFDGADPEFLLGHSGEADEDVKDDELVEGDATIVAEPTGVGDEAEADTDAERGRRRAVVLAALTALLVLIGATVGALVAGRSGGSDSGKKSVPERTVASTTTTVPTPTTSTPPASAPPASVPPPASTAPRAPVTTSRRAVPGPIPAEAPVPADAPPPSPPPEPPTSPPVSSPPTSAGP